MTPLYLVIVMAFYLLTALDLYMSDKVGLSLTFVAYALGNVGLIMAARGM